jgi:hypothetical protein
VGSGSRDGGSDSGGVASITTRARFSRSIMGSPELSEYVRAKGNTS